MTMTWVPDCVDFNDTCQLEMTKDDFTLVKSICRCSLHKDVAEADLAQKIIAEICTPRTQERLIADALKE